LEFGYQEAVAEVLGMLTVEKKVAPALKKVRIFTPLYDMIAQTFTYLSEFLPRVIVCVILGLGFL